MRVPRLTAQSGAPSQVRPLPPQCRSPHAGSPCLRSIRPSHLSGVQESNAFRLAMANAKSVNKNPATAKAPCMSSLTRDQTSPKTILVSVPSKPRPKSFSSSTPVVMSIPQPTLLPLIGQGSSLSFFRFGMLGRRTGWEALSSECVKKCMSRFGPIRGTVSADIGEYSYSCFWDSGGMSMVWLMSTSRRWYSRN